MYGPGMDKERAQALGGRLRTAAIWETPGIAPWSLESFPSPGGDSMWMPDGKATVHWIHGKCLVNATAGKEGEFGITARPVETNTWSVAVSYRWGEFGPLNHQGLRTNWRFEMPGEVADLEVAGEVVYRDKETPKPDDAEQFAVMLAKTLMGS